MDSRSAKDNEKEKKFEILSEGVRWVGSLRGSVDVLSDGLGCIYSGLADDDSMGFKSREGAVLFCAAEGHLNEEMPDEAVKAAKDALAIFKEASDSKGYADTLRIIVSAYRMQQDKTSALDMVKEELEKAKSSGDAGLEASMTLSLGEVSIMICKTVDAVKNLEAALKMFRTLGNKKMEATAQLSLAETFLVRDDSIAALTAAEAAADIFKDLEDARGQARAQLAIAQAIMKSEVPQDAVGVAKRALAMAQDLGDVRMQVTVQCLLAELQLESEDPPEAARCASQALQASRKANYTKGAGAALTRLIAAHVDSGDVRRALEQSRDAASYYRSQGNKRGEADAQDAMVEALLADKDREEALRVGWEAMELLKESGEKRALARSLLRVCLLHLINDQEEWALHAATEASKIYYEVEDRRGLGLVQYCLIWVNLARQKVKDSLKAASEAQSIFKDIGDKRFMAGIMMTVAQVHNATGETMEELSAAKRAQWTFEEVGDKKQAATALLKVSEVYMVRTEYEKALRAAEKAQVHLRKVGHMKGQAIAFHYMANCCLLWDKLDKAAQFAAESKTWAKKVDDKKGEGQALQIISQAKLQNLMKEAQKLEKASDELKASKDISPMFADIEYGGKPAGAGLDDPIQKKVEETWLVVKEMGEAAAKSAQEAVATASKADDQDLHVSALHSLTQVQLVNNKADAALKTANEALAIAREMGDKSREASSLILLGEVHYQRGRGEEAVDLAQKAMKMAKKHGDPTTEEYGRQVLELITGAPVETSSAGAQQEEEEEAEEEWMGLDPVMVMEKVKDTVLACIGVDDEIAGDAPLMDSGMDSLASVEFRNQLVKEFEFNLSTTLVFDFPSIKMLTDHLVEESKAAAPEGKKAVTASRSSKALPSGGAAAAPTEIKKLDKKVDNPTVVGSWDGWIPHAMNSAGARSWEFDVKIGVNGWESFQILMDDSWERCLYPDKKDAHPYAEHKVFGPDEDGAGKNWTIGFMPEDKSKEGSRFRIRLFTKDDLTAEKVDWVKLTGQETKDTTYLNTPFVIGTWNNWGEPSRMDWDEQNACYHYLLELGKQGWESFQILFNGEWKRCVHPDRKDGCPYATYKLCGPDADAHGNNFTIGRHPLDRSGEGTLYDVRFYVTNNTNPEKVEWVLA